MKSPYPKVHISILNWNGCLDTIACLNSLEQLDYEDFTTVVVDNNSRDESVERIRKAFPYVEIISSDTNLGYAGGNRLALDRARQAGAELFWILNNDTTVMSDTLRELVMAYHRWGECLYGSVPVYLGDDHLVVGCRCFELKADGTPDFRRLAVRSRALYDEAFPDRSERVVANVSGSSLLIPMSVVKKHGFIDETFFFYSEETDYCLRLAKCGIPAIIVPASIVIHKNRGSYRNSPNVAAAIRYYQVRNRLVVLRRHAGVRVYLLRLVRRLWYCLRLCLLACGRSVLLNGNHSVPLSQRYVCLGVLDALLGRMGKRVSPDDFLD